MQTTANLYTHQTVLIHCVIKLKKSACYNWNCHL